MQQLPQYLIGVLLLALTMLIISCGSDDCVTCVQETAMTEVCDEEGAVFTDINGDTLTFDQFIADMEMRGYTCE